MSEELTHESFRLHDGRTAKVFWVNGPPYLKVNYHDAPKKDWRIGLKCKPKYETHLMRGWACEVVDVMPSGTAGIVDPDGVLMIRCVTGRVFLEGAEMWMTG